MLHRRAVLFGLPLVAAGCSGQAVWAPDDAVIAARFRHPGPPQVTLVTCLNNETRSGAHTGLVVNASERVIFDPAGSFRFPEMAERNDVVFGATDAIVAAYTRFQSTDGYHAILQTKDLDPGAAERLLALVKEAGPVGKSQCTRVTSQVLQQMPGFGDLRTTWLPDNLMRQVAKLPGVTATLIYTDVDGYADAARAGFAEDTGQPVSQSTP